MNEFPPRHEIVPAGLPPLDQEKLKERESHESNPDNYEVNVCSWGFTDVKFDKYDLPTSERRYPVEKYKELVSGFIDFRKTSDLNASREDNKKNRRPPRNVIWLGDNHYEIAERYAKFQNETDSVKDYMIGVKIGYDEWRRKLYIYRNMLGRSFERDDEHIAKVIDAADVAMNRDLIDNDPPLQEKFFLEDYGLKSMPDSSKQRIYSESEFLSTSPETSDTTESPTYDLALFSQIDEVQLVDPSKREELIHKIEKILAKLSNKESNIRIPFYIKTQGSPNDDAPRIDPVALFSKEFETTHPETYCWSQNIRFARRTGEVPEQYWGYLCIGRDIE